MGLAVIAVLAVFALWWFSRTRELFYLSVRTGRVLVVRGRVPAALLGEFREILAHPPVRRASVRGLRTERGARLAISGGVDEGRAQRLRNVFGIYPISRLRAAPVIGKPTVGQIVGIAWLAWLFDRSINR